MSNDMVWGSEPPVCICGKRLPNFASQTVTLLPSPDGASVHIEAVTFSVRCACGASWDLKKTVPGPSSPQPGEDPKR